MVAVSCEFLSGATFICSIEAYFMIILYVAMSLYDITKLTFSFVISIIYICTLKLLSVSLCVSMTVCILSVCLFGLYFYGNVIHDTG